MKLFSVDSPFISAVGYITDLIILNLLWIICCVPIITIGTSTTALYGCFLNRHKESSIIKIFFSEFKSNFKQSTILWLIQLVGLFFVASNFWFYMTKTGEGFSISRIFLMIPTLIIWVTMEYIFPLQSHFENSVKQTVKNSVIISIAHFPTSLLISLIQLAPIILLFVDVSIFLRISIVILLLGQSAITKICSLLFNRVFKKYLPAE